MQKLADISAFESLNNAAVASGYSMFNADADTDTVPYYKSKTFDASKYLSAEELLKGFQESGQYGKMFDDIEKMAHAAYFMIKEGRDRHQADIYKRQADDCRDEYVPLFSKALSDAERVLRAYAKEITELIGKYVNVAY